MIIRGLRMQERLDALNVALTNEMREHEFYISNAERTANPVGRAMFQQIAGEELEHYERLKQLHETWEKQKKWPAIVPLKVKNTVVRDVFKDVAKRPPQRRQATPTTLRQSVSPLILRLRGRPFMPASATSQQNPVKGHFSICLHALNRNTLPP